LDGIRFPNTDKASVAAVLFQNVSSRSFSTANLNALYDDTAKSLAISSFDSQGDSTKGWVREADSLDLRNTGVLRMTSEQGLEIMPRGGTASHFSMELTGETVELACFARQWKADEQDLIDDALGELLPKAMELFASIAASLRPTLVYRCLMKNAAMGVDNVALFDAAHANVGTTAALAEDKLQTGLAAIAKQREGGRELNLRGAYLIVPPSIERTAGKLARDVYVGDGQSTPPPIVRSDSRLENGIVDPLDINGATEYPGSPSTWFLSTATGQHGLEARYLEGMNRRPQLRSGYLDQSCGEWGVWFDVRHFVAIVATDYRGLYRGVQ
jgi:hypothetical protein